MFRLLSILVLLCCLGASSAQAAWDYCRDANGDYVILNDGTGRYVFVNERGQFATFETRRVIFYGPEFRAWYENRQQLQVRRRQQVPQRQQQPQFQRNY